MNERTPLADRMTPEELEASRCLTCGVRLGHDVHCPEYERTRHPRVTGLLVTPNLDIERLRRVFHEEYQVQGGCHHQNQYQRSWDCYRRAAEVVGRDSTPSETAS